MVLCNILVTFLLGDVPILSKADLEGRVIAKSTTNYVVDFSKDALLKGFNGAYELVLVPKENCVEL